MTVPPEPGLLIANEFAEVEIRRVLTHNGTRLEIRSPRLSRALHLDAMQLESLTWQEPELFSQLLQDPFGPPSPPPDGGAGERR